MRWTEVSPVARELDNVDMNERVVQAHLFGLDEFELHATAGPGDEVGVARVVQQGHQELPELQRAAALVRCALAKNTAGLLLHFACWEEERGGGGEHGYKSDTRYFSP